MKKEGEFMIKKHGFTLAETLITLGIIGVVAALTIPMANSLKPDENKVLYLKAFDTLTQTVQGLVSNTQIFPICRRVDNLNCSRFPLFNMDQTTIVAKYNKAKYSGTAKLCNLLADSLGAENADCSKVALQNSDMASNKGESIDKAFDSLIDNQKFYTPNGMQFVFNQAQNSETTTQASYLLEIYVDINGNNLPNCIYDKDSCKNPDRFKFQLYADGTLRPADPMGIYYLNNRTSYTKKKVELTNTVYPAADATLSTQIKSFCGD